MSWYAVQLISALVLPPLDLLVLGAAGLLLLRKRPRLGQTLIAAALALLYLLSTAIAADGLLGALETRHALPAMPRDQAGAIVVLGAGTYFDAPEYGGDTVNALALERLRYAAHLYRATGKPVLTTGGNPAGGTPEGLLMKRVLQQDFGVPVRWTEDASENTYQNARFSYRILKRAGITRIYLVTHAWHMPRAVMAFEKAGFSVVPAPTGFTTRRRTTLLDFVPQAKNFLKSYYALHEAVGLLWYELK